MKETAPRKMFFGEIKIAALFLGCVVFLSELCAVGQTNWMPAYNDDQLDIINKDLGKWKSGGTYRVVRDIFRNRSYEPDWHTEKADATSWDMAPDSFTNEQEAARAGCHCDYIKSTEKKTCLLKLVLGQGAWIFTYDPDASGRFNKSGVIVPPTWYGFASVEFVNVLGRGKPKFILVQHQGDCGTGIDEKIDWLIGWHEGAFRTVFRETVYAMCDGLGAQRFYQTKYRIIRGKVPRIEARSQYEQVHVTATPYDFHSTWRDWFFWNEEEFSFYDLKSEEEKIEDGTQYNGELGFRLNLEMNRVNILKLPPLPQSMWDYDKVERYWDPIDRTDSF